MERGPGTEMEDGWVLCHLLEQYFENGKDRVASEGGCTADKVWLVFSRSEQMNLGSR